MHGTPEIKTILIPVDGSAHARKAALIGAMLANRFGSHVVLLHALLRNASLNHIEELTRQYRIPADVLEKLKPIAAPVVDFGFTIPTGAIGPVITTELLIEIGRKILEVEKSAIEGQGVGQVDLMMEDGDPVANIVEAARIHDADFIVMGHRGLGALEQTLVGSVANKVGQLAQATVVSVK
jgi:nucleotide-binding universal stress UspA family protein